jgi:hypothetical protein
MSASAPVAVVLSRGEDGRYTKSAVPPRPTKPGSIWSFFRGFQALTLKIKRMPSYTSSMSYLVGAPEYVRSSLAELFGVLRH